MQFKHTTNRFKNAIALSAYKDGTNFNGSLELARFYYNHVELIKNRFENEWDGTPNTYDNIFR